jgi:hypothetical protein
MLLWAPSVPGMHRIEERGDGSIHFRTIGLPTVGLLLTSGYPLNTMRGGRVVSRSNYCGGHYIADATVALPRVLKASGWSAGTTAEYRAVQQDGQQYWRNTIGAST